MKLLLLLMLSINSWAISDSEYPMKTEYIRFEGQDNLKARFRAIIQDIDTKNFTLNSISEATKDNTFDVGLKTFKSSSLCNKFASMRGDQRLFSLDEKSLVYKDKKGTTRDGARVFGLKTAKCLTTQERQNLNSNSFHNMHDDYWSPAFHVFREHVHGKAFAGICFSLDGSKTAISFSIKATTENWKNRQYEFAMLTKQDAEENYFKNLDFKAIEKDPNTTWFKGYLYDSYSADGYLVGKSGQHFITGISRKNKGSLIKIFMSEYDSMSYQTFGGMALQICKLDLVLPLAPDGYTGDMLNGNRHGKGTQVYTNGKYVGDWHNDLKDGSGIYSWTNGDIYSGEWIKDQRTGKGIYTWANGEKYEGQWINGKHSGKGTFNYKDGSVYDGDWLEGQYHGHGTRSWANGEKYEGNWSKNERSGQGIHYYADGSKYEGNWRNGIRHGKGKLTYSDGRVADAEWNDGEIVPGTNVGAGTRAGRGTITRRKVPEKWTCKAHSSDGIETSGTDDFRSLAIEAAIEACKSESKDPESCSSSFWMCKEGEESWFNSLAIDVNNGSKFAWSVDKKSRKEAEEDALKICGSSGANCTIVLTWVGAGHATYISANSYRIYGWSASKTSEEAIQTAKKECIDRRLIEYQQCNIQSNISSKKPGAFKIIYNASSSISSSCGLTGSISERVADCSSFLNNRKGNRLKLVSVHKGGRVELDTKTGYLWTDLGIKNYANAKKECNSNAKQVSPLNHLSWALPIKSEGEASFGHDGIFQDVSACTEGYSFTCTIWTSTSSGSEQWVIQRWQGYQMNTSDPRFTSYAYCMSKP